MIIDKVGDYRLLSDFVNRGSISVSTIPAGTVVRITAVDKEFHKVHSRQFDDWQYWNINAEPVEAS